MDFVQIISLSRDMEPANLWHWNRTYFSCRLFAYVIWMAKRNSDLGCKQQERTENVTIDLPPGQARWHRRFLQLWLTASQSPRHYLRILSSDILNSDISFLSLWIPSSLNNFLDCKCTQHSEQTWPSAFSMFIRLAVCQWLIVLTEYDKEKNHTLRQSWHVSDHWENTRFRICSSKSLSVLVETSSSISSLLWAAHHTAVQYFGRTLSSTSFPHSTAMPRCLYLVNYLFAIVNNNSKWCWTGSLDLSMWGKDIEDRHINTKRNHSNPVK